MPEPMTVTMVFQDNPLAGQPGQTDFTMTISSEPDMQLPEDGSMPDPEDVSLALLAAVECVKHIAGITLETAFVKVARGGSSS